MDSETAMIRSARASVRPMWASHALVLWGAVSGKRRKARSWTVTTSRRARVGGGTKFGANSTSDRANHSIRGRSNRSERRWNHLAGIGVPRWTRLRAASSPRGRLGPPRNAPALRYQATYVVPGSRAGSSRSRCHV